MSKQEVLEQILQILQEELGLVAQGQTEINDLDLDSLGFVHIIVCLENKMGRSLVGEIFDRPRFSDRITIDQWAEKVAAYLAV